MAVALSVTLPLLLDRRGLDAAGEITAGTGNRSAIPHLSCGRRKGDQIDGWIGAEHAGCVRGAGTDAQIENLRDDDGKVHMGHCARRSGCCTRLNIRFRERHER